MLAWRLKKVAHALANHPGWMVSCRAGKLLSWAGLGLVHVLQPLCAVTVGTWLQWAQKPLSQLHLRIREDSGSSASHFFR